MSAPSLELPQALRRVEHRQATGLHVIEGVPPFIRASDARVELVAIYHNRILLRSSTAQKLVRQHRRLGVPTRHVSPEAFRRMSRTIRASGILAVARQRWSDLDALEPEATACVLVLEGVRSPGNLGTILRTAEAAGLPGVVLLEPRTDPYDVTSVRASMGAIFDVPLVRATHDAFAAWAQRRNVFVVGTSPRATIPYTALRRSGIVAVLLGDERQGLTDRAFELSNACVRIPIRGRGDSLNVAVAAGILVYAALGDGVDERLRDTIPLP